MKIAIFSAFPEELKHILKNVSVLRTSKGSTFVVTEAAHGAHEILLIQTGPDAGRTQAAFDFLTGQHPPDMVVSLGFGGALYEEAAAGDLIWADRIFLCRSGKRPQGEWLSLDLPDAPEIYRKLSPGLPIHEGSVVTIEERMDKRRLRDLLPAGLPFAVCDMETFFVAKSALERRIPVFAIRSVTDRLDEEIPEGLSGLSDKSGNRSLGRALATIMENPDVAPDLIRMGRTSHRASRNLWSGLSRLLEILR